MHSNCQLQMVLLFARWMQENKNSLLTVGAHAGGKLRRFPDALTDTVKAPGIGGPAPISSMMMITSCFLEVHLPL